MIDVSIANNKKPAPRGNKFLASYNRKRRGLNNNQFGNYFRSKIIIKFKFEE